MEKSYPCYRCSGEGMIRAFGHVLGGACFKCHGSGKQASKPNHAVKWTVLDASGKDVYNVTAKTDHEAVKKALIIFARSSTDFVASHDMSAPVAVLSEEYWTPERIEEAQK